jgi:preprotein translocase subunit SecF
MTEEKNWYDKTYKLMLIIPIAFLIFSVVYLYNFQTKTGDLIRKDVSITGGTTVTIFDSKVNINDVRDSLLKDLPDMSIRQISDFRTGEQKGFIIATQKTMEEIRPSLEDYLGYKLTQENSSVEFSGSNLSQGFYQQLRIAILAAFALMAIVILLIFRKTIIPSIAVITCAFADIVMTIAVVDMMGMTLSTAGVMAFLLLIGYSVDTDILLTSRVIKRKEGTVNKRIFDSFKTGITMTLTALGAVLVAFIITHNSSEVLSQIFSILLIGLMFDIFNTWITNAAIIKWYADKSEAIK